jgi:hypothetical protein
VSAPDLSHGIEELAALIYFHIGAWHDFGYENPPAPDCKTIPPLGERSDEAIRAAHAAVKEIDKLAGQLLKLREQLVTELRQNEDIRGGKTRDEAVADRRPGGASWLALTPEQAATVRLAFDDAKWVRVGELTGCAACDAADEEPCAEHRPDAEQAAAYDALGCELFGEDFGIQMAVTP